MYAWRESVLFCLHCGWCLHPSLVCKLWESERMLEDIKYSLLGLCSATWHAQLLLLHSQLHTNSNYLEKKVNSWKNETISGAIVAFCAYLESSRASPWCILEQCCTTSGMDGRLLLMGFLKVPASLRITLIHKHISTDIADKPAMAVAFWEFSCCSITYLRKGDLSQGCWYGNSNCVGWVKRSERGGRGGEGNRSPRLLAQLDKVTRAVSLLECVWPCMHTHTYAHAHTHWGTLGSAPSRTTDAQTLL